MKTVPVETYIKSLLLQSLRTMAVNNRIIESLILAGYKNIPESIYYQQLSRIPESELEWIRDTVDLIEVSIQTDIPYKPETELTEFDLNEINGIDIESTMRKINEILDDYSINKTLSRRKPNG